MRPAPVAPVALVIALVAGPAAAGDISHITADLDGDGVAETFVLDDTGQGEAVLVIDGSQRTPPIAWVGGMAGQVPYLETAPNGSLRIVSGNDSVGRDRWQLVLTLAHRGGEYIVAGYTYSWSDTLDLAANGTCDVNLLAKRGEVSWNGGPVKGFATTESALPVTDWFWGSFGPNDACFPAG